jgi:hypothetical protein
MENAWGMETARALPIISPFPLSIFHSREARIIFHYPFIIIHSREACALGL